MSHSVYQLYHTCCRHSSVDNIQSNCNKGTYLQSLSAILLFGELCQTVLVHRRYTDPLQLYRQGFDITEYRTFSNYTLRQGPKLQLDWELSLSL